MNKDNHAPGNGSNPHKHIGAKPWLGRFVSAQVRQPLPNVITLVILAALLLGSVFFVQGGDAWARPLRATAPGLGTAASFAVLAASTVTNAGAAGTLVTGDLGVSPGTIVTGFPPGLVVGGTIHAGNAVAAQAQADTTVAYNDLAGQACNTTLTGQDLGGLTLTPAVYCFSSAAQLSSVLTLDGQGDPDAVFIFQIADTLTTASASSVRLINGASACNVFWQVGSSATLGSGTIFNGNLLALASNTLTTGASVTGRVIALTAAVTMDSNAITGCNIVPTPLPPTDTPTSTPLPPVDTATPTPLPPVDTATPTPLPPVDTATPTPLPPVDTATPTPLPPVDTATPTPLPPVDTATPTPLPPVDTATPTPLPPVDTATPTPLPPVDTATPTPLPPTLTLTPDTTPGRVEIDKVFCPTNDGTRTEFEVFPPRGSKPLAKRTATCDVRAGIAFTVKDSNGQVVAQVQTRPSGIIEFTLPSGTYTLIEDSSGAVTTFSVEGNKLTAIFVRNFEQATPTPLPTLTNTPAPTSTPMPPTKTPRRTKTPLPPTRTAVATPIPPTGTATKTKTPRPPTRVVTNTPVPPTKTPRPTKTPAPPTATPTITPTRVPGEVKLIKFFCTSGDTGTIISVNGVPQPKGQNGCRPGDAQFRIDGGPVFALGSTGIRLLPLPAGAHTIVEVATGKRARFTVQPGKITTIIVYNF